MTTQVTETTAELIRAFADEVMYSTNRAAQGLKQGEMSRAEWRSAQKLLKAILGRKPTDDETRAIIPGY